MQHCIEGQIVCVRKLLQGKLSLDLRQKSTKLLQKMKAVQEGKLTKAIKSVKGQHKFFCNVDSLLLPDTQGLHHSSNKRYKETQG